jgi:hypothetical protein
MMGAFRRAGPYGSDINDLYSPGKIKQTAKDFANIKNYRMGALVAAELLSEPGDLSHWYAMISKYPKKDRTKIETTVKSALADQNHPKPIKFVWNVRTKTKKVTVEDQGTQYVITIEGYPHPYNKPRSPRSA